ncbi:MAG: efflux RND transporter periplasmic adaptor subunit [Rhodothermales bacterium]|nr:efflux RND transporter periplasmic adaptor subunit [Rhodothermales bacterium]
MRSLLPLALVLLLAGLSVSQLACSNDAQSKPPDGEEEETPPVPVEAATATTGDIAAFFTGTASLEAEGEALVVARTTGLVTQLFAEEGQYVEAGQPLAKLDDERYTLELARVEAALAKQRRAYERIAELHEKQLTSAEEYERVKSDYETQQAQAELARLEVTHATIRAPISGVVSERLIKVGNMVTTNTPAYRLTDFDPLLAVLHVPERELSKLRTGQRAELRLDALPGQVFQGRIERISPVVDPATGTFKVTVEVRDSSRRLKPGMFGRVRIVYDTHEGVTLVPREAVLAEDDEAALYVIREGMAFRLPVVTGYTDDTFIEITEGVEAGDVVIVTGQSSLRDSSKVEVIGG